MNLLRHVLLSMSLLVSLGLCAQTPVSTAPLHLKSVVAENTLEESAINKMEEDQHGFIWLATISGLVRFDGYEYHHYKRIPGDTTSLSDNFVKTIYRDSNQRLWAGTFGGLNLYNPGHDNFIRFAPDGSEGSLSDGFINDIAEDANGMLWLATYNGLNRFDPTTGKSRVYFPLDDSTNPVKDITAVQFSSDTLWIGSQGQGLYFMTGDTFHRINSVPEGYRIYDIYKTDDLFLLSTESGLLNITDNGHVEVFDQHISFHDVVELKDGRILLCTHHDGLLEWNRSEHRPEACNLRIDTGIEIDRNIGVYSMLEDHSKNIWFCYDGLKKISAVSGMFATFVPPRTNPFRRSDEVILYILPAGNNEICVVTAGGAIHRFNYATKTFRGSITTATLRSGHIQGIFTDSRNRVWGLNQQNRLGLLQQGSFVVKKKLDMLTPTLQVSVVKSLGDKVYIGSPSGLIIADLSEKSGDRVFREAPDNSDSLANNSISALVVQNEDSIWVAGGSVLHLFLPRENRFVRYGKIEGHDHYIAAIDLDANGNVWIARTNGLAFLDKNSGQLREVRQMSEPTNFVSILTDTQGKVWAGTTDGVVCYDPSTSGFNKFGSPYGAQDYYYRFSSAKSADGHLFFGGLKGFTLFHPTDIFEDVTLPRVVITKIDGGKKIPELEGPISRVRDLTLNAEYTMLNIDFAGIYYNDPQGLKYSYYMDGVDHAWHHPGSRRYVSYSNLPRGEQLSFHLKATSPSGMESPVVKLSIFIQPYFWESRWFAAVLVLILVLATWTAYRMRVAELKRRQSELKRQIESATIEIKEQSGRIRQIQDTKLNFYTNISHEFRTPLTLIAGPVNNLIRRNNILSVDERLKSLQLISRNTERMLRLVNQLLDLSKLDEGLFKLSYSKVNVSEQARKISELFVPLANQHAIDFRFNAPPKLEMCIDADVCEKILYNLLSNAFKFTPDGRAIELAIAAKGTEEVCIMVRDTGDGIEGEDLGKIFDRFSQGASSAMKAGTGIGLAYVKKLAELHGGQIEVASVKDYGSTFTVLLAAVPGVENQKYAAPTGMDSRPPVEERLVHRVIKSRTKEDDRTKILVIDDNGDVREFIYSCLHSRYAVMQACDGREGFDLAISSVPELIVSDVMMPAPNGLELCRNLKTNEITSHIPVILLTAKAAAYHQAEGYRNGADSYITKPFTCDVLLARIDNLIAGRRRLRDLHFKSAFLEKNESAGVHPENEFLRKCSQFVCENLDNPELDSAGFCKYMGMSQTQLYRKLVAVTGLPIGDFIQSYRLRQALSLLKSGRYTVSEIAYRVGFKDPSYFTKCFSKHFHFTPSKYLKDSAGHEQSKINTVEIHSDFSKGRNP